jgi:hypothetical protein
MTMFKKQLKSNHEDWRNFSYSQGDVNIKINLRTDIKSQLKDCKIILEEMLNDVQKELERKTL